jgi:hypothetical protein
MAARQGLVAAMVLLTGVGVAGCKSSSAGGEAESNGGATVTDVEGKDGIHRVELTADAAQRIGLETATVGAMAGLAKPAAAPGRVSVPLDAVLYDKDGATWVYVGTAKYAFERARVAVSGVDGKLAVLTSGPPAGTAVVTVGAAELRGAEDGVEGE